MSVVRPAGLLLLAAGAGAWAQALPSAGSILRQQELSAPRRADQLSGRGPAVAPRPALDASGVRVRLKSVRFTDAGALASTQELAALVQDAIGKELTSAQLLQLADRVTNHLRAKGWFLARGYLPQQDVTDGDLEIAILAGRLQGGVDGITVGGNPARLSPARVRGTLAAALQDGGDADVHAGDLERGLLLLNELPGISAHSLLERGSGPDSTRMTIDVKEAPLTAGSSVGLDNFGGRYTGEHRATGQLRLNDLAGEGDGATLGAAASRGLGQVSAGYALPLGFRGLNLSASASALDYRIGKELAPLDLNGRALTAGLRLAYPIVLGTRSNLRASLAYDTRALADKGAGLTLRDKRVTSWTLGLGGERIDAQWGGGATSYAVALVAGKADLSRVAADLAADQAGPRVNGSYAKWTFALARVQRLQGPFSLQAALSGQGASRNLDPSEKFILGGSSGVRAYPAGEGAGDSGTLLRTELRYDAPAAPALGSLQVLAFADAGHVTLNRDVWGPGAVTNATGRNAYGLAGWGIGIEAARSGRHALQLAWAQRIGGNPGRSPAGNDSDGRADRGRLLLQAIFQL